MVEHRLAKARVEGSNPFSRSKHLSQQFLIPHFLGVYLLRKQVRYSFMLGMNITDAVSVIRIDAGGGLLPSSSPLG